MGGGHTLLVLELRRGKSGKILEIFAERRLIGEIQVIGYLLHILS